MDEAFFNDLKSLLKGIDSSVSSGDSYGIMRAISSGEPDAESLVDNIIAIGEYDKMVYYAAAKLCMSFTKKAYLEKRDSGFVPFELLSADFSEFENVLDNFSKQAVEKSREHLIKSILGKIA